MNEKFVTMKCRTAIPLLLVKYHINIIHLTKEDLLNENLTFKSFHSLSPTCHSKLISSYLRSLETKLTKLKLSYFWGHHEKVGFFGKGNNTRENRRQQEKKKTKYEMD